MGYSGWTTALISIILGVTTDLTATQNTYRGVEFSCPTDFVFHTGYCYLRVSNKMIWKNADKSCKSYGATLINIQDQVEHDYVIGDSGDRFWTGLSRPCKANLTDDEALWAGSDDKVNLKTAQGLLWNDGQPNIEDGACVAAIKSKKWSFWECDDKLPFVCRRPAEHKDAFQCSSVAKGIRSGLLCDGTNDCGDGSDESSCDSKPEICSAKWKADTGGQTLSYGNCQSCVYTIESTLGTRIKLSLTSSSNVESNADVLEIWTGGSTLKDSYKLTTVTGILSTARDYYSDGNFIIIRFLTDYTSTGKSQINIQWTTNVPEITDALVSLTADDSMKSLQSPFYQNFVPVGLSNEWKITAAGKDQTLTLMFEEIDLPEGSSLTVRDGEDINVVPVFNEINKIPDPPVYLSKTSSVRILLLSQSTMGKRGFKLTYKQGCTVDIQAKMGKFMTPGFLLGEYPTNVQCTWTLRRPAKSMEPISLRMRSFDLFLNSDYLKVFKDMSSNSSLHQGDGFTGNMSAVPSVMTSETGYFRLEFSSNRALNKKGFDGEFSVDCPAVPEFNISTTAFEDNAMMGCPMEGYSFEQEELNMMPQSNLTVMCMVGGKWNVSRTPSCQVTYCGTPPPIANGFIHSTSGVIHGAIATYRCYSGFQMNNTENVTCQANGQWTSAPSCDATSCVIIPNFDNGNVRNQTETQNKFGDVIEFYCDAGYETVGPVKASCQTNGNFSHSPPTCKKITCPLPMVMDGMVMDGDMAASQGLMFGENATVQCKSGYMVSGTNETNATITCGSDKMFNPVITCENIDECKGSNDCKSNQDCSDTVGSYKCVCKEGYQVNSNDSSLCEDIKECNNNNGGCTGGCEEMEPGYQCNCSAGFSLYRYNGFHNLYIPATETGLMDKDVYRINHTCVRNVCPTPGHPDNGQRLSKNRTFYFEEELWFSCDHGYLMDGDKNITCGASGMWSAMPPLCKKANCSVPSSVTGVLKAAYPPLGSGEVAFGETLTLECYYGKRIMNRTLHCGYKSNDTYELQGDRAACPEIDCMQPDGNQYPGSNFTLPEKTTYESSFVFKCADGGEMKGMSSVNKNATVVCLEEGRWDFGNLTCSSKRCEDPGTPGGAEQIVTSYEAGQILRFNCTRDGFTPVPANKEVWECVYDPNTNQANWNQSGLPECLDTTKPVIHYCPGTLYVQNSVPVYLSQMPTTEDNSGAIKRWKRTFEQGMVFHQNETLEFKAMDYSNNEETCKMEIVVFEKAIPMLNCPDYKEYEINTTSGFMKNMKDEVSVTGGTLHIDPPMLHLNVSTLAAPQKVMVIANSTHGYTATCSFLVYTKAVACFAESFPVVPNSVKSCTAGNNTDLTCTVSCNSGFVHGNGTQNMTYTCNQKNNWNPQLPPSPCLAYENSEYVFTMTSTYTTGSLPASPCKVAHDAKIEGEKAALMSNLQTLCNNFPPNNLFAGSLRITEYTTVTSGTSMTTTFKLAMTDKSLSTEVKRACEQAIQISAQFTETYLLYPNPTISCTGNSNAVAVSANALTLTQGANSCPTGMRKMLTDFDEKCVSCPPGEFMSAGTCTECPNGQYQDNSGQTTCKTCPDGSVPSTNKTHCVDTCPAGFISESGLQPCSPCPVDQYWYNATTCMDCPSGYSTINTTGSMNLSDCKAPCAVGHFSQTGHEPCMACPLHHYQNSTGSTYCDECASGEISNSTGVSNSSSCVVARPLLCFNPEPCKNNGTCNVASHRVTCTCNDFDGEKCEKIQNPCDSNPCKKGSCTPNGSQSYTCKCPVVNRCTFEKLYNTSVVESTKVEVNQNESSCQQHCADDNNCTAAMFGKTNNFCHLYTTLQTSTSSNPDRVLLNKTCIDTQIFSGINCEKDEINKCANNTECGDNGMCQDLLGENFKCLCAQDAKYSGERCTLTNTLCAVGTCQNGGKCESYGSVREVCFCKDGYTGEKCETIIDNYCSYNTMACMHNGSCSNQIFNYQCNCASGFSGKNCQNVPNFCGTNPCGSMDAGSCYENFDRQEHVCKCHQKYRKVGGTCQAEDACLNMNCVNGTCNNGQCSCTTGFTGSLCQLNINDCKNDSCKNGGSCVDGVDMFKCSCMTGFTGQDCGQNMDNCGGQCTGPHTQGCIDLIDDFKCNCTSGWKGKNCTEDINECMSYPCQHGATCQDLDNDYNCNCTAGWQGKNCDEEKNFCEPSPCQNSGQCYNMTDSFYCRCVSGTEGRTCKTSPEVCSVVNPCVSPSTCKDSEGTAVCNCTANSTGVSCQLKKDFCAKDDICQNSGTCNLKDDGYNCECLTGFSGDNCATAPDSCSALGCSGGSTCYKTGQTHMCLCPMGKAYADKTCKAMQSPIGDDFDLFLDPKIGSTGALLNTPMRITNQQEVSVMFWMFLDQMQKDCIPLVMEPMFGEEEKPDPFFKMNTTQMIFSNGSSSHDFEFGNINGKNWQFVAFSWNADGNTKVKIDALTKFDGKTVPGSVPKYMQLSIGNKCSGRISQVTVWNSIITPGDMEKYFADTSHTVVGTLVQGWTNIDFQKGSTRKCQSKLKQKVCDGGIEHSTCENVVDRVSPSFTACPDDKSKQGALLVEFSNLLDEIKVNNQPISGAIPGGSSIIQTIPDDKIYTFGVERETVFAIDASGNYGVCRFNVYHKFEDECKAPKTIADVEYCSNNNQSVCGITCPSGQSLSFPISKIISCSKFGVFDFHKPYRPFNLPACGVKGIAKRKLVLNLVFQFGISCQSAASNAAAFQDYENKIKENLLSTDNKWKGLCNAQGGACTGVTVAASCSSTNTNQMNFVVTFAALMSTITRDHNGMPVHYSAKGAVLELTFDIRIFSLTALISTAQLQFDLVVLSEEVTCDSGFALVDGSCVECSAGTFYSSSTMKCEPCPIGEYQPMNGSTSCQKCTAPNTTLSVMSQKAEDCVEKCNAGHFYNETKCDACPKNFYQDQEGSAGCKPCPKLGWKTESSGSTSESACKADCGAGKELKNNVCTDCPRGKYRTRANEQCVTCENGRYTNTEGSQSSDQCKIDRCQAGESLNSSGNCVPCPYDYYQTNVDPSDKDNCTRCDADHRTSDVGSNSSSACLFVCTAGSQHKTGKTCELCPRGKYRTGDRTEFFKQCTSCDSNKTTEVMGATSKDNCSIDICEAGQELKSVECADCELDHYQSKTMPNSTDTCQKCPDSYGTQAKKSKSLEQCEFICPAGQESIGSDPKDCTKCKRGYYRQTDMNRDMYFSNCTKCPTGKTTEMEGATSSIDNCTIDICIPGQQVINKVCEDCPVDTYQDVDMPSSLNLCKNCSSSFATEQKKSNSSLQCKYYCPAGKEDDGTVTDPTQVKKCKECPQGKYRSSERDSFFKPCEVCPDGNNTEGEGSKMKTDCSLKNCSSGYIIASDGSCEKCPMDYYQSVVSPNRAVKCQKCDSGKGTKEMAADSITKCEPICDPGKQWNSNTSKCDKCPMKYWNNGNSSMRFEQCVLCPENYTTPSEGSISAENCTILDCDPGYKIVGDNCIKCDFGYYQPNRHQTTCEKCATNLNTSTTGAKSSGECQLHCPRGSDGNETCTKCLDDMFKPLAGSGVCQQCTGNYTSNNERTVCNVLFCDKGWQFQGGTCDACPQRYYKDSRGNASCTKCDLGFTTPGTASTKKEDCSVLFCVPGKVVNGSRCDPCPVGTYKMDHGRQECANCSLNMTTPSVGSINASQCTVVVCEAGYRREASSNTCKPCQIGYYQDTRGQSSCMKCADTYTTNQTASDKATDCIPNCPAGKRISGNTCELCQHGQYQPLKLQTSCLACANGFNSSEGSTKSTDCLKICPVGTRRTARTVCTECPIGSYQNMTGQTNCTRCQSQHTTMSNASTSSTDCVPICQRGEEYSGNTKQCNDCNIGYYKDSIGNSKNCVKCPDDKLTSSTKSTDRSDCSIDFCEVGKYLKSGQCTPCEKNYYQNKRGQISCVRCEDPKNVTRAEGSESANACILDCPSGREYNFTGATCDVCEIGFYKAKSKSEACLKCPAGTTNFAKESATCSPIQGVTPSPPSTPPKVNVRIRFTFLAVVDCNSRDAVLGIRNQISIVIGKRFGIVLRLAAEVNINIAPGSLFCGGNQITQRKRRKRANNEVQLNFEADVPNVPESITDGAGNTRSTQSVLQEDLSVKPEEYQPPNDAKLQNANVQSVTPVCSAGQILNSNQVCENCPVGKYQNGGSCSDCPVNQYQDEAAKTSCKLCSDVNTIKKYTKGLGANSSSDCVSVCEVDSTYCNGHGTCQSDAFTVSCQCTEKYSGTRCTIFTQPKSETDTIVGGVVGAVAFLMLIIVIIVIAVTFKRKNNRKQKAKSMYVGVDDELYKNPLYDNRSDSVRPFPGIRNNGYKPDPAMYAAPEDHAYYSESPREQYPFQDSASETNYKWTA